MSVVRLLCSRWFALLMTLLVLLAVFGQVGTAEARPRSTTPAWAKVTLACDAGRQGEITVTIRNPSDRTLYLSPELYISIWTNGLPGGERGLVIWMWIIPDAAVLQPGETEPFTFPLDLLGAPTLAGATIDVHVDIWITPRTKPFGADVSFPPCDEQG